MTTNQPKMVAQPSQYDNNESTKDGSTVNCRNVLVYQKHKNNRKCLTSCPVCVMNSAFLQTLNNRNLCGFSVDLFVVYFAAISKCASWVQLNNRVICGRLT